MADESRNPCNPNRTLSVATLAVLVAALLLGAAAPRADAAGNGQLAVMMSNGELRIVEPGGGVRTLSTLAFSGSPTWSPDARTLAYRKGDRITLQPATGGAETP